MTTCSGTTSTATVVEKMGSVSRPDGWSEETHESDTEPNYAVEFLDDKVNQIKTTNVPEEVDEFLSSVEQYFYKV